MWPAGTLCITIAANIAKTGILTFDACFPDSVVGFTPNAKTNTEYVQRWFSFVQQHLERTAPESAQKNINLEILRGLRVPLPPFDLQRNFAALVQRVEHLRAVQREALRQAENLFASLLHRAFGG
jgi:type I restriction enzyme S subunit